MYNHFALWPLLRFGKEVRRQRVVVCKHITHLTCRIYLLLNFSSKMIGRNNKRTKDLPELECEDSILSSIAPPQAATAIYGWGAAFASGLGGGGNPNSISKKNPKSGRGGVFDRAQELIRDSPSLMDKDESFGLKLTRSLSFGKSKSKAQASNKIKKQKREKRNKKKQEAKRAEAFLTKSSASRSQSRSRSRSGGRFRGRYDRDEDRDVRSPSFDDEYDDDTRSSSFDDDYDDNKNSRSGKSKKSRRGKSKNKGGRNSLFDSNGTRFSKDDDKDEKSHRRSLSRSRSRAKGGKSRSGQSRSKSRSQAREIEYFEDDVEEREAKVNEKKDKQKVKDAEDDAYDKLQNLLGITCCTSSTCAVAVIVGLHLL